MHTTNSCSILRSYWSTVLLRAIFIDFVYIYYRVYTYILYDRWQCYINNEQYRTVIHKETERMKNWKYRKIGPGPSSLELVAFPDKSFLHADRLLDAHV
jgi:hypothetical protein